MLGRGVLRVAAYQARRACAPALAGGNGCGAAGVGARSWLSATPSGESSSNDDPTPAETKLAFTSTVYGKDQASAAELSAADAAAAKNLKQAAATAKPSGAPVTSKSHDARAMFDSSLSQQAEDGKASGDIKREVASDTPDATRVAFRASAYGKDPQASAALSEQEAAEVEALRVGAQGAGLAGAAAAAPVHDSRNMFDSDLSQGAGSTRASDAIKRDVAADTPDATRVAFRASVYGKDPQAAAEHSEQEAAEVEALRKASARSGGAPAAAAAPVHHNRSMFDSDLTHGAGVARASDAIKRDVAADTPEATRLVFGGSDYGKDPNSMTRTAKEQAEMDALAARTTKTAGAGTATAEAAPIHHDRSMFDSELTQSAGVVRASGEINRKVAAGTPDVTRLAFKASVYGKDPSLGGQHIEDTEADVAELRERNLAKGESAEAAAARRAQAPVHHDRSMFDSDLTQGAGAVKEYGAIKRDVETDTPALTRLSFFGSTCEFVFGVGNLP